MISRFAFLIIAMVIICPVANAQSSRPDSASKEVSKEAESDAKGILAGPEVLPDSDIGFDGRKAGRGGRGTVKVPARRWFVLLRSLELSPQQESEIRPIIQSLQKFNREHEKDNGKRIRQLQKQAQKARRNKRDVPREVRQELAKLRAKGPKAVIYQKRIWDKLTTDQQEQMSKSLAAIRKEITKQRKSRAAGQQPASDKPAMKPTQQDKKTDGLDEQTKRRLNFLKSHQASTSP